MFAKNRECPHFQPLQTRRDLRQTLAMGRIARRFLAGYCYHAINRGNRRATIFHSPADYRAFLGIVAEAQQHRQVPILAACLMPNHFHFVLKPQSTTDMSRWFHWLLTTQVSRYHRAHDTSGRLWQGRFKAFPIQEEPYLVAVMRYVERNALRAGLVRRAEDWRWGSLNWRMRHRTPAGFIDPPSGLPADWLERVNRPETEEELEALRTSVNRERPFGSDHWAGEAAQKMGLPRSVRGVGRPSRGR